MDYIELDIRIEPFMPWSEILTTGLAEIGFESFTEQKNHLQAYIPVSNYDKEKVQKLINTYSEQVDEIHFEEKRIKHQNWNAVWESDFKPVAVGDELLIRAPFHEKNKHYRREIVIQPQMSFGTGHHATTWLIADWLLKQDVTKKKTLDMGTGTGILAILVKMLGAHSVLGIDIEADACENARDNACLNGFNDIEIIQGDESSIPKNEKYDLIIANINKNVLLSHFSSYAKHMKDGAKLIISGFFTTDQEELVISAKKNGFCFIGTNDQDNWAIIEFELNR